MFVHGWPWPKVHLKTCIGNFWVTLTFQNRIDVFLDLLVRQVGERGNLKLIEAKLKGYISCLGQYFCFGTRKEVIQAKMCLKTWKICFNVAMEIKYQFDSPGYIFKGKPLKAMGENSFILTWSREPALCLKWRTHWRVIWYFCLSLSTCQRFSDLSKICQ